VTRTALPRSRSSPVCLDSRVGVGGHGANDCSTAGNKILRILKSSGMD
jgi:hypothetical protein